MCILIPSCIFYDFLARVGKSLAQVVDELPKYVTSPEIKVGCPDKVKFELVSDKISKDIKAAFAGAEYVEIDGIRFDTKDEMAVIRASQNGPYLTVKYEARDEAKFAKVRRVLSQILHKYGEIDFKSGVNTDALD